MDNFVIGLGALPAWGWVVIIIVGVATVLFIGWRAARSQDHAAKAAAEAAREGQQTLMP